MHRNTLFLDPTEGEDGARHGFSKEFVVPNVRCVDETTNKAVPQLFPQCDDMKHMQEGRQPECW
jgi:hypothetical protein